MTNSAPTPTKYCMRCSKWTDHHASNCRLPNPKQIKPDPQKPETHLGWPWPKGFKK